MEQRLARRGTDPAIVERVIQRLQELGLLNDLSFARQWVENRDTFRPRSRRLLQQELQRKGVSRQVIDEALASRQVDDYEAARHLASARLHRYSGLPSQEIRRKLGGFLARRGFAWDVVQETVDAILEAASADEETVTGAYETEED